jgi:1,4-alpha-glucan branching enzyme
MAALAQKGITMLKREAVKGSDQVKITFVIPNDPDQPRISVVGDFNNWDPGGTVFVKRQNNTRSVSTTVDAGQRYRFRYYVGDGTWINDDSADAYEPNEHGSHNCMLIT